MRRDLNEAREHTFWLQSRVESHAKEIKGNGRGLTFVARMWDRAPFLTLFFLADLEGKMAEATSAADALWKTLDADATEHSAL